MDAEAIWVVLRAKAPSRAPLIEELAEEAAGKLRLVRDTFPTYTLHDEVHAANAHYHDIGMVYSPDELAAVRDDAAFARYLETHHEDKRPDLAPPPEAYLDGDSPEGEWWTR